MKSIYPLLISSIIFGCSSSQPATSKATKSIPSPVQSPSNEIKIDIEKAHLPISTKTQLSIAVVEADQKWHIWMEGRSGVLHSKLTDTFWLEQGGVSLKQGSGQYNHEIDGHTYLTPTKISTLLMSKKMESATENKTNIKIILEMTNKGKYITQVKPPTGRSARLATSTQKPIFSAIFMVENKVDIFGKVKLGLIGNIATETKATGLPVSGKKLVQKNPKIEVQKKWEADFKGLYGKDFVMTYSTMINLDNDEQDEGFFCTKIPSGMTCFVHDTFKGNDRYYFTGFNWKPKEVVHMFATENGSYISHQQKLSKGAVTKVLRFDGSGYTTEKL
jgi:hypothetical protein